MFKAPRTQPRSSGRWSPHARHGSGSSSRVTHKAHGPRAAGDKPTSRLQPTHISICTFAACNSCTTFPAHPTTPIRRPTHTRTHPHPHLHTLARQPPPPATHPSTQRGVPAKSSCNTIAVCLAAFPAHPTAPRPPPSSRSGSTRPPTPRAPRPPPKTGPPTHTPPRFAFLQCIAAHLLHQTVPPLA